MRSSTPFFSKWLLFCWITSRVWRYIAYGTTKRACFSPLSFKFIWISFKFVDTQRHNKRPSVSWLFWPTQLQCKWHACSDMKYKRHLFTPLPTECEGLPAALVPLVFPSGWPQNVAKTECWVSTWVVAKSFAYLGISDSMFSRQTAFSWRHIPLTKEDNPQEP